MRTLVLFTFLSLLLEARCERMQIICNTELFEAPHLASKTVGIFGRGSVVEVIYDQDDGWAKVRTESLMEGYVKSGYLTKRLNARDKCNNEPFPKELFAGENLGYYQGRGLCVTVAGLRARAKPSKGAPVVTLLKMNKHCSISFYPYDENEWVLAGYDYDRDKSTPFYVQRKYVGQHTDIFKYLEAFGSITNPDKKKKYAERILEMSFFEQDSVRKAAIKLFVNFAESSGLEMSLEALKTEIYALEKCLNAGGDFDYDEHLELIRNNVPKFYYDGIPLIFKNEKELLVSGIKYTFVDSFPRDMSECSWGFERGYYFDGGRIVNEGDNEYIDHFTVWKMDMTNPKSVIIIGGIKITSEMTEREFIDKLGFLVWPYLREETHSYSISVDGGGDRFHFKNGKIVGYELEYGC